MNSDLPHCGILHMGEVNANFIDILQEAVYLTDFADDIVMRSV